jgi:hypothetical protein
MVCFGYRIRDFSQLKHTQKISPDWILGMGKIPDYIALSTLKKRGGTRHPPKEEEGQLQG